MLNVHYSTYLVVGVGVLIIFRPSRPQWVILCENETNPARLKVREKVLISGILQSQETPREIVVCRGNLCSSKDHSFFMVLYTLINGGQNLLGLRKEHKACPPLSRDTWSSPAAGL